MTKFKIGDMVKVVNYGHLILMSPEMLSQTSFPIIGGKWVDIDKDVVGQTGIVVEAQVTQERSQYAVKGPSKHAWYDDGQLELIYRPEYPAEEIV